MKHDDLISLAGPFLLGWLDANEPNKHVPVRFSVLRKQCVLGQVLEVPPNAKHLLLRQVFRPRSNSIPGFGLS